MPIPRDLLGDDEEVLVDMRPHWIFLFGPASLTVIAAVVAIVVLAQFPHAPVGVSIALAVMVTVPAVWLAGRVVRWRGLSLIITNSRLLLRRGVFGQDLIQLRLQRITDIHSTQSLFERLIGTGRLVVDVPGEDGQIVVEDVRRPRTVQRVLSAQLDKLGYPDDPGSEARGLSGPSETADDSTPPHGLRTTAVPSTVPTAPPTGPGSSSIPEQLIQLDDLRRRGIITEEEFAAKKTDLFGRL